ncbi:MAG: type III-B CRISPR module-associated protein Cmr3 [bacterium]|nr:type III-B CRISPR module-associated protein Cmr3 [bacterium]
MIRFIIKPIDVLFFGSGRPFNLGDVAKSNFPPYTHTFAGAISAIFNLSDPQIIANIYGPFLYNQKDNQTYFPKPANIYKRRKKENLDKIFTIDPVIEEDFMFFKYKNTNIPDEVEYLCLDTTGEELEPFQGIISEQGLRKWIKSGNPDLSEIKSFNEVFEYESRIGIKLEPNKDTVVDEDGLYRINFIRMKEEWSFLVYVKFNKSNTDLLSKTGYKEKDQEGNEEKLENEILNYLNKNKNGIKLGGEMKNAHYKIDIVKDPFANFQFPNVNNSKYIKILFLNHSLIDIHNLDGLKTISYINNGYSNLVIYSDKMKMKKFGFRTINPGTVVYVTPNQNNSDLKKFWFKNININIQLKEKNVFKLESCINFVTLGIKS